MDGGPDDGAGGLVRMQRGLDDYYYHADEMGSTVAVTGAGGAVLERYEYGDFGQPRFYDGAGLPLAAAPGRPDDGPSAQTDFFRRTGPPPAPRPRPPWRAVAG